MERFLVFFFICWAVMGFTNAALAAAPVQSNFIKPDTYAYMYPYMNNQMRKDLNPGVSPELSTNPMDVVVKTTKIDTPRRVVARSGMTSARSATPAAATTARNARATNVASNATPVNNARAATNTAQRRVVARSGVANTSAAFNNARSNVRSASRNNNTSNTVNTQNLPRMASTECVANYTECMDMYCERENTAYNRCYCSSKLAQIDSTYQKRIDSLITQILTLQNKNHWSDEEMNEYWMSTVGKYTNTNSWENIDNTLNINWMDMESRVRGQNAFVTGHEYCSQYLQSCYYMAGNLRDVYRSQIARDCSAYEQSLNKIQNAAESIVEAYK